MTKKRIQWMAALGLAILSLLVAEGCCKKAEEKIKSAEAAIAQAKEAEAGTYAPNDIMSAEEGLARARELCKKGQCKKAEEEADAATVQARLAEQTAKDTIAIQKNKDFVIDQKGSMDEDPFGTRRGPLEDVPFEFDSAELSPSAKAILNRNAAYLQQNPALRVKIEGHCDERGTDEYNLALGAKRAKSVYDNLVSAGIAASRMETISYGESLPKDSGHDEAAWSMNRRAHFEGLQY